jgi:hypothetical protein
MDMGQNFHISDLTPHERSISGLSIPGANSLTMKMATIMLVETFGAK